MEETGGAAGAAEKDMMEICDCTRFHNTSTKMTMGMTKTARNVASRPPQQGDDVPPPPMVLLMPLPATARFVTDDVFCWYRPLPRPLPLLTFIAAADCWCSNVKVLPPVAFGLPGLLPPRWMLVEPPGEFDCIWADWW